MLVVEDDEPVRRWLVRTLSGSFHTIGVGTFAAALAEIERGVDVLLCDVRLPDGSGVDLIRHAAAARKRPRIIAMSGRAVRNETFILGRAGALAYLEKPFTHVELQQAVQAACRDTPPIDMFVAAYVGHRSLADVQREVRRVMVDQALALTDGVQARAARLLGMSKQRLSQVVGQKSGDDET